MRKYYTNSLFLILILLTTFCVLGQKTPGSTRYGSLENVQAATSFPAIDSVLKKSLQNLNPVVPVRNGAPIGKYTVAAQYIVDKNGIVSDVKASTSHGYGMEEEVMRVLKKSPRWEPASQEKQSIKGYGKFAVTFLVQDENIAIDSKTPYTLYTNTANELSVHVKHVKTKLIKISTSGGIITKTGDENYLVQVNEESKQVLMTIKKRRRKLALVKFEVKQS